MPPCRSSARRSNRATSMALSRPCPTATTEPSRWQKLPIFRGKADKACRLAEPFLTSDVLALRISSCFICGFANLSLDHAHAARACLLNLASSEKHLNDEYGDRERAAYLLFTASSSVLLHLKPPVTADDFYKVAALLPESLRLFATYAMAHQAYLTGDYGRCIG